MKKMIFVSIFLYALSSIMNVSYSHTVHDSDFEKTMEKRASDYIPEVSINSKNSVAIVNPGGKGLTIGNINDKNKISLYKEYYIDSEIIWSRDGRNLSTIIQHVSTENRYIIVLDLHGYEVFKKRIGRGSVIFGWVSSGHNQGLYINSNRNIIFPYQDDDSHQFSEKINNKEHYSFSYSGENYNISIFKNNEKVREINGMIYDIYLSPLGNYLSYGFEGGFSLYSFEEDTIINIPQGTNFSWSPDEKNIAFEKTKDNGHYMTGSDIYIYSVIENKEMQVTNTPEELEARPGWKNNNTLYYSFFDSSEVKKYTIED